MKSELQVFQFYHRRGFRIFAHRYKTPYAEIDWILIRKNQMLMVEVKTLGGFGSEYRLSPTQKRRLENAHQFILNKFPRRDVELHLVFVNIRGHVEVFEEGAFS